MIETIALVVTSTVTIANILANLTGQAVQHRQVERVRVQLHKLVSVLAINLKKDLIRCHFHPAAMQYLLTKCTLR